MISEVVMPQMGADMEEGTIIRWLKQPGDSVERGEIIAEIETDKANVEIESFESGIFRTTLAGEGDTVSVGTVIAVIAAPDDDISSYKSAAPAAVQPTPEKPAPAKAAAAEPQEPGPTPARKDGRVRASPVARKLAEQRGIDLASIEGTGPDGRIVRRDVDTATKQQATGAPAAEAAVKPAATAAAGMSRMRQTIARRMSQSKREAPHYYVTIDIDMTEVQRLRSELKKAGDDYAHISVNDFIVKASALALRDHPHFNTWFVDGEVRQHEPVNVCIAIALEEGLIAPAILNCGDKSLVQIGHDSRDLAERAKSGRLKPEEYSGGTFTVSNLGMFRVEALIAIIQPPQTAILGVGTVRAAPVAFDGQVIVKQMMKVALSADHRVTDGAQGAQFLNEIRRLLETPALLLI